MTCTLDKISLDESVIIKNINGEDMLKRRFLDLGFLPHEKVKCVLISPFKDPKAYLVNRSVISIRNKDAKNIEVEYERD